MAGSGRDRLAVLHPGVGAAVEVVELLEADRGGHLGRERAALSDLADEQDVVALEQGLRSGQDRVERNQLRLRYVALGVFGRRPAVDDLNAAGAELFRLGERDAL